MKAFLLASLFILTGSAIGQSTEAVYQKFCANCHGADYQGGNAKSLVDGVWAFGKSKNHIIRNVKYGITHLGMPAYEKSLTDKQIKDLVNFILEAEKNEAPPAAPLPTSLQTLDYDIDVEVWTEGLDIPWGLAFLNKDTALVTERPGNLRIIERGKLNPTPIKNTPQVLAQGQGGMLAVAVDPDYNEKDNQWIYLGYSHGLKPEPGEKRSPAMTRIVRGRIRNHTWVDQQIVFEAPHDSYRASYPHFGTRIVFDKEGHLYFSIGDRGASDHAQDLAKPNGKLHRVNRDGSIPTDNPFVTDKTAMPSIFSYGNRNPQGISMHPETDQVWASEHGPFGGDELNLIQSGNNYGWPVITYGKNYNGTTITDVVRKEGMQQPAWYWKPSTAVCGIDFYSGGLFPKWNNNLLVGALKYEDVRVLDIENDRVMHEEVILKNAGRVRDVVCGPDGAVYVVLNDPGTILRLTPGS